MRILVIGLTVVFVCAAGARAEDQGTAPRVTAAGALVWKPAPRAFPPGSEVAVLYGDPAKPGMFVLRARAQKGWRLNAHTHPAPELVTVLSGAIRIGVGGRETVVSASGFSAMPPGVPHWLSIEEDAVVQIHGMGPWGIDYADAKDDPRK